MQLVHSLGAEHTRTAIPRAGASRNPLACASARAYSGSNREGEHHEDSNHARPHGFPRRHAGRTPGGAGRRRRLPGRPGRCHRARLRALARFREIGPPRPPFARRRDRAHARVRCAGLRLQVRQWPSRQRRPGPAHGDGIRRPGRRGHGPAGLPVRPDAGHGAAHRRHLGAGRAPAGATGLPQHGADRRRIAVRIPGPGLHPPAGRGAAAHLRHRRPGHAQAGGQPGPCRHCRPAHHLLHQQRPGAGRRRHRHHGHGRQAPRLRDRRCRCAPRHPHQCRRRRLPRQDRTARGVAAARAHLRGVHAPDARGRRAAAAARRRARDRAVAGHQWPGAGTRARHRDHAVRLRGLCAGRLFGPALVARAGPRHRADAVDRPGAFAGRPRDLYRLVREAGQAERGFG